MSRQEKSFLFVLLPILLIGLIVVSCNGAGEVTGEATTVADATETPVRTTAVASEGETPSPTPTQIALCINSPTNELCSTPPHDVIETFGNGYSALDAKDQSAFDNFSWQLFVALNWPADESGTPLSDSIGSDPAAPRVWESYQTSDELFNTLPSDVDTVCQNVPNFDERRLFVLTSKSFHGTTQNEAFLEATGQPLIDRNLNFVVYEIFVNPVEATYIISNSLTTKAGQANMQEISFPLGYYDDKATRTGGTEGAIEIKTSWRILTENDTASDYYNIAGAVYIAAENSESGEAFCFPATMGLVGMHILQRITGPYLQTNPNENAFDQDWTWSSFEHIDNAPDAANAQDPTDITTTPAACDAPSSVSQTYSFYNPDCTDCQTNDPPPTPESGTYTWSTSQPYAIDYATDGEYGTQVVRCWQIFSGTETFNRLYRGQLADTVWANYQLIGTQWKGGIEDPVVETGDIPQYLSNTTMETYIQPDGSCLACHAAAQTVDGKSANFSFLLGLAEFNPDQ